MGHQLTHRQLTFAVSLCLIIKAQLSIECLLEGQKNQKIIRFLLKLVIILLF